ncbi:MAG: MOSC domain-containing protein [Dehalococcoidia bacterium]
MSLGEIKHITRYPVKSMRGEAMESVAVDFTGLPNDRCYAFVQEGEGVYMPFPWLTARDAPQMLQCEAVVAGLDKRDWPNIVVRTPNNGDMPVDGPELAALLEAWSGKKSHIHSDYRGCQDVAYVSIISTATVRALSEAAGVANDHRRFRMNFVVDVGDEPFAEKAWLGKTVQIGGAKFAVHEQDRRCNMITLDPDTGESAPAVLKQTGELNGACAGVYCSVLVEGTVGVGDQVSLA